MSSCARSMPALRAAQSFTASAVKQPVRRLHITGPKELPSQYLKPAVASSHSKTPSTESATVRTFNTTRSLKRPNDTSTIDFAFMPTADSAAFAVGSVSTAALNIPILPDNYRSAPAVAPMPVMSEAVAAEVETVSMALPGQVSVLSESDVGATHDGNAMDVFKVVETLHRKVEDVKVAAQEEAGVMREVFDGIFGDLLGGSKRVA